MFRKMRRENQNMSYAEIVEILERATSGVLAVQGDGDYPYAVPLSYVYKDSKITFHCANAGHKLDAISKHDKVSFCIIHQDEIVPEKFTTLYKSVIIFGRARVLGDDEAKRKALELVNEKYAPDHAAAGSKLIDQVFGLASVIELSIDHMTGKKSRHMVAE